MFRDVINLLVKSHGFHNKIHNIQAYRFIKKYDLFDYDFYSTFNSLNQNNLLVDYLINGSDLTKSEKSNLFPDLDNYKDDVSSALANYILLNLDFDKFTDFNKDDYELMKNSGLFDEDYYKNTYPMVDYSLFDPLIHYGNVGSKKGFNPSFKFDTEKYLEYNGIDEAGVDALLHYLKIGQEENFSIFNVNDDDYNLIYNSNLFDVDYYITKYPHVNYSKYDPVDHYLNIGYLKGYNPSFAFDTDEYLNHYPDVKNAKLNPLLHYLTYGINENRSIYPVSSKNHNRRGLFSKSSLNKIRLYFMFKSKFNYKKYKQYMNTYATIRESHLFDEGFYRKKYPETLSFDGDLIIHFMFDGVNRNFKPNSRFDTSYYRNKYSIKGNPLEYYIKHKYDGKEISFKETVENKYDYELLKKSGFIDKDYYLKNYPNSVKEDPDPVSHYLKIGYHRGYNPSEEFDTNGYLDNYPNVKKSGMNPLVHYLKYGKDEGKVTHAISKNESDLILKHLKQVTHDFELYNFTKDNSPLVSIIILNRNGLNYLKTLFQDFKDTICYPNYEIIVVDNNSSDNSVSFLKGLVNDLPLKIIENKVNESFSKANNQGVELSQGEYILLLNNDMEPLYGWLNHMMFTYLNSDGAGVVGSKLIFPYRKDNITSLKTQNEGIKYMEYNGYLNSNDGYIVPYNIKGNDIFENEDYENKEIASVLGACLLIKKDLYEKVDGLDESFFYNYEDIDLCFKVIQEGYKVIYAPKSQLFHYYKATREDSKEINARDMENRIYLYYKWNKWLTEKLFMDKVENNLIYGNTPLSISYITSNSRRLINEPLIDYDDVKSYDFTKKDTYFHRNIIPIKNLGWELTLLNYDKNSYKLKNNTMLLVSDVYNIHPDEIKRNNIHHIDIALVNNNIDRWMSHETLEEYDLIFTNNNEYLPILSDNYTNVVYYDTSLFNKIKEYLSDIYETNNNLLNNLISNKDFEEGYADYMDYITIKESEYFDINWYQDHYDLSDTYHDPVLHYLKVGGLENNNPGPNFSNEQYYKSNPDVEKAHMNPLLHYEKYGRSEGRSITYTRMDTIKESMFDTLISPKFYPLTKKIFPTKKNRILFYSPWDNKINGNLNENSQIIYDKIKDKYDVEIFTKKRANLGENLDLLSKVLRSKVIIIDTGFSLLSQIKLKPNQKVINIWHACGAFKKIAYDAAYYTSKQREDFNKEFRQYDNFIVSSKQIVGTYANAHGLPESKVLPLGVPRTDIFKDSTYQQKELSMFYKQYPELKNKRIILFAPTFRDNHAYNTHINWDELSKKMPEDMIFVIKRHNQMSEDLLNGNTYENIVYIEDVSIFTLMFASEMMITDYSSVIFEYSLLNKPVIHYCPDYEEYVRIRDFYLDFDTELYGEIIKDPQELVNAIINSDYTLNEEKLEKFRIKYMESCDGNATDRVVELIEKYMDE